MMQRDYYHWALCPIEDALGAVSGRKDIHGTPAKMDSLRRAGIYLVGDLRWYRPSEVLAIPAIGKRVLERLAAWVEEQGGDLLGYMLSERSQLFERALLDEPWNPSDWTWRKHNTATGRKVLAVIEDRHRRWGPYCYWGAVGEPLGAAVINQRKAA